MAVLHAAFCLCAAAQELVLYREMAPRAALGRRTVSMELETKVQMVQFCVEHVLQF